MQVFAINLPEDVVRRRAIESQLQGLGMAYEIFPAVKGLSLSQEQLRERYDEARFVRNEGRNALPGELGCALSHIAVYRAIVERRLPFALVLEDDAWLNPNLPHLAESIEQQFRPEERNIFLLTWVAATFSRKRSFLWSTYYLAEAKSAWCTHGYVVSNGAAVALLSELFPVTHLADCWNWLRRHRVVRVLAVSPTCITCDLSHETRTTAELAQTDSSGSMSSYVLRKVRRAFWLLIDYSEAAWRRLGRAA